MVESKERATFPGLRPWGKFFMFLAVALLMTACSPASKPGEDLQGQIQDLKKELKSVQEKLNSMQEKLDKLQAGQQNMLALLQKSFQPAPVAQPFQPPPPQVLTVGQLLASKDQYLGSRVTVKGKAGPVIVNQKALMLVAPEGMVKVLLSSLPEPTVVRLTSIPLDKPITVSGIVSLPTEAVGAKLQITAEAVDF